MSVCFFSKKAFSFQIDNYFAFAIFTGSDCLCVCVNIELFNIEQRRFLHNLKWKQSANCKCKLDTRTVKIS